MIVDKVLARIYGKKRGWCFTPKDFLDLGSPSAVWQSLARLEKKGIIRKILRGVYDYPVESKLFEGFASPDIDKVAQSIARSCGWTIVPEGNTALNLLGLSTQIPAHWVYLTDGRGRTYEWEGGGIKFINRSIKEIAGLSYNSAILVQAIKTLGKEHVDDQVIQALKKTRSAAEWARTEKECQYITTWVYELIKMIAASETTNE